MVTKHKTVLDMEQFNKSDIAGLIELSESVGWDYDEQEIGTVLSSGKVFGHKNTEGKIVSSAAIVPYDTRLASIGMVIVNEEYRGLSLGKKVTQKCIDSVSKDTTVMLIATEIGKPLYENMGFISVDYVHKFLCDNYVPSDCLNIKDVVIEEYNENDLSEIIKLDKDAFGDSRSHFLHNRIKQSEQCLVVKCTQGNIIGYGMSILGPSNLILGPIVANDSEKAGMILDRLAKKHSGKLRIDTPSGREDFILFLECAGFIKVNTPPIMILNSDQMPKRNHTLFGIAAQIFG
ncbi:putative N-acetyltransferase YhbS [Salirhabdus euzebyi]|uniref:Putative N-acetyltransferase YhbS n=1 Tax=Salirhabdus euzebyi TaxID=394506 RepID=A0A841PUS6_9BACI|nr:GNAT family N-acetyltransferase [Salirhabdus euzebyi]MBB6452560.1 putative N-acetyltransferase YhbS [Salirhabdus euzebyi]